MLTHGDHIRKRELGRLGSIMVAEAREFWAKIKKAAVMSGHLYNVKHIDEAGIKLFQTATLSAPSKYE